MATFVVPNVYEQSWPSNQEKVVPNVDSGAPMVAEQASPPEATSNPVYMISNEGAATEEISSFSIRHFVSSVREVDIVKCWPFRQRILDKCLSIGVCPQLPPFIPPPKHPERANNNSFMTADCFCPLNPSMIQGHSVDSAQKRSNMDSQPLPSESWEVIKEPEARMDEHMASAGIHTETPDSVILQEDGGERAQSCVEIQEGTVPTLNSRSSDTRENSHDSQCCLVKDLGRSSVLRVLDHNMPETESHTDHTPTQGKQDTTGGLKVLESVIETFPKDASDKLEEATVPSCDPQAEIVEKKNKKAEDTFGLNFDVLMQVCPVCLNFVSTSNTALNAHIDHCLEAVLPGEMGNEPKLSRVRLKPRKMRSMAEICANAPPRTLEYLEFSTEKCTLNSEKVTENASCASNWRDSVVHRQPRTTMYRGTGWKCKDKSNKKSWQLSIDYDMESDNNSTTSQIVPLSTSMDANAKLQQPQDLQMSLELGHTETAKVLVVGSENLLSSEAFTDCGCSETVGSPGIAPIDTSADEERRLRQEAHMAEQMSAQSLMHKKTAEYVHDQHLWTKTACSLVSVSQVPALTSGKQYCSRMPTAMSGLDDREHFMEHHVHWLKKSMRVVPRSLGHERQPHLCEDHHNDISASSASHTFEKVSLIKEACTGQTGYHPKCGGKMRSLSKNGCFESNHASLDVQRENVSQCAINAIPLKRRHADNRLISTDAFQTNKRLETLAYSLNTVSPQREISASTASDGDTSVKTRKVREPTMSMESENKCTQEDDGTQCTANMYSRRRKGRNLSYHPSRIHECTFAEFDTNDTSNRSTCLISAAERSPLGILHVSRKAGATNKHSPSNERAVGSTFCSSGFDELSEAIARTKITCDGDQIGRRLVTSKFGTSSSSAIVGQNGYHYHQEAFKTFCGPNPFATLQQSRQVNICEGTQRVSHTDNGVVEGSIWGMGPQISHENVGRSSASYCKSFTSSVNFGSKFDTPGCSCAVTAASRCVSSHMLMEKSSVNTDQLSWNIPMLDYVRKPAGSLPSEDGAVYDEGFGIAFTSQFVRKNTTAGDLFPAAIQGTTRINRRLESKLDSKINGYRSIDYPEEQGVVHIFGNHVFKLMGKDVMVSNKEPGFADVSSKEAGDGFDVHCVECRRLERSEETNRFYTPTSSSRSILTGQDMNLPLFGSWCRDSYDPRSLPRRNCADARRQSSPLPFFQNVDLVQYNNAGLYTPHPNPFVASQGRLFSSTFRASPSHVSMRLNGWHGNMASLDGVAPKRGNLAPPFQRGVWWNGQQSDCLGAQGDSFFSSIKDVHPLELDFQQARPSKVLAEAYVPAGISSSMPSGTLSDIIQNADRRFDNL